MTDLPGDKKVLKAITILSARGYCCTKEEISAASGLAMSTVNYHLANLRDKGLVDWRDGKARTIHRVDQV